MRTKYYRDRNAVITGAASGIGLAFAEKLAEYGTNILISDINLERLEQAKNHLRSFGVNVIGMKCDVTKRSDVTKMADKALNKMGEIHFLFSNAGVAMGGPFEHFTLSSWKRIININLWGMIHVISEFIPKFLSQGFGHVIVTSSIAGSLGVGGLVPYSTTKFANSGFCEALYGEYKSKGIDVSIVNPFPLKTNLIETVGISFPSELMEEHSAESLQKGISRAKEYYWENFCAKRGLRTGFCGGFNVDRSIDIYLKKIRKKKLYIFERRYGRFFQFIRGFFPRLYKKILSILGKRHTNLLNETFKMAETIAENEKLVKKK